MRKHATTARAGLGPRNPSIESQVMLAQRWEAGKTDPTAYLMSEKLDGMRAIWDGTALFTRTGKPIAAPPYFTQALPVGVHLDGELFLGRGKFQNVVSVCRTKSADEARWRKVRYVIFDAPHAQGGIAERLNEARSALGTEVGDVAHVHSHIVCQGAEHVFEELARITALTPPGEGLMLAAPNRAHRGGRCTDILKVKIFHTEDAKVVEHKEGKGRHLGRLGALGCRLRSGSCFDLGSGFSDADREDHLRKYPVGTIVEFRYFELTEAGVPRFPTFARLRPDIDPSEFP